MADLARKYERIATDSAPPTPPPTKSTSKRTMSLVVSGESPAPPSPTPAVVSGLPSIPAGDSPSCFRCDRRRTAVKSGESPNKRKRFLASEAEDLKIETEDETCSDGNLRREAPASLEAPRRPETRPPPPAAGEDAAKVRSACAAEIEAYLSAMEREQQRRFADKYNYDVVNDVPLEGRYEWIPINVGAVEETLR